MLASFERACPGRDCCSIRLLRGKVLFDVGARYRRGWGRGRTHVGLHGYTFRARKNRNRYGEQFLSFAPGISREALTRISREVRSWRLHRRADLAFNELARRMNPVIGGWINY
ncbi:group II intron maturase-specific domain-containing protein [Streptomyces sp. NPDC005408]|uniref:group II intron maturase-specific domain-containing protein n=1 Tax=Streptomyces sp. NPDC005408 TaxID=3155341 RepID=UPI0033BDA156